jgi:hypothetical protein
MKQKEGFRLRTICGENIIVAEGIQNVDFSRIISLNETAAYLWRQSEGKVFDAKSLTQLLLDEYEVDEATALSDVRQLLSSWMEAGIIEA